ncbi:hypothetical protein [Armatimonas sp.]|uniref:hypothetical protein n=1 Tax=Armatimonas sp. TaxID=1872638 RepID=UPI00286B405D|nr:hypothetical protein [Armatimonas sp.]
MTEEELERQARLWHVENTLADEKVQAVRTQLKAALPAARTRRRWQTGGIVALALTSVPLGGALVVALSVDPLVAQTRIELLQFPEDLQAINGFALATDGTVAGECAKTRGDEGLGGAAFGKQYLMWPPGSSVAETLRVPGATLRGVRDFLPSGELVGLITQQDQCSRIVLWQQGKWQTLPPLPGYSSTFPKVGSNSLSVVSVSQGLIGYSATEKSPRRLQATLWRNGNPEPLSKGFLQESPWANNTKGDFLLNTWKGIPRHIGDDKILIGELEREGKETTVGLWTSPTAQPQPLWEQSSPISKFPFRYADLDAEGKVVGEMKNPLTGAITPFIWKAGRYRDLQTLLPPNSDWILQGAMRVAGRTVIGMGQYKGKPAVYRMTLPPGCP